MHGKSEKISHETIVGIAESIREVLMNLKKNVLRSNLYRDQNTAICFKGLGYVIAEDYILSPTEEIVDNTQLITNVTKPVRLCN